MTRILSLEISEELYERLQENASAVHTSPEIVSLDTLKMTFGGVESLAPDAFERLTDPTLWNIVAQPLPREIDEPLRAINAKTPHSESDAQEIERLVGEYDLWLFRRTRALEVLFDRGNDIRPYLRRNE